MIRPITDKDIPVVAEIYNYYIKETVISYEEEILSTQEMTDRVNKVNAIGTPWLVAEKNGKIIGYCYACFWNQRSAYRHSAEITIYLRPEETGKGWGSKLYKELFAALKSLEFQVVIAGVGLPNPASIALHEKMGLRKVAHFEKIGYKFNQWLDVGYWQGNLRE